MTSTEASRPEPTHDIELSIVMPCLNEAETLAKCLQKAQAAIECLGLRAEMTEVPVRLHKGGRTRSPHLRSWRDGWRHLRLLLLRNP